MPGSIADPSEPLPEVDAAKLLRDKALDLLSRRSHFRQELETKLRARGFDPGDIDGALDTLEGEGYLDDRSTAEQWVAQRLRRRPEGPRKLLAELRRRGADSEVASDALRHLGAAEELDLARQATERKFGDEEVDGNTLGRFLDRRGFHSSTIARILRDRSAAEPLL
ncbi:MAG: regulatory protein RecX [Acidobacteriota bacterium]